MKTSSKTRKHVGHAITLLLAAMLAACGGDDKGQAEVSPCLDNPLIFFVCLFTGSGDASPAQSPVAGEVSVSGQAMGAPIGVDGDEAKVVRFVDFEPNNSLSNANIVSFPASTDASAAGALISGRISGTNDDADSFIFTPTRSGLHSVYICAETCATAAVDDELSIMLLDQNQTTVDGTPAIGSANQEVAADLTAGMAYYVQVRSNKSGLTLRDYQLVIVD